jgi:hypothetical protein
MSDVDEHPQDRPDTSGRSDFQINFLADDDEIGRDLDRAERRARFLRTERWENARQYLVLFSLGSIAIVLLLAFLWSVWILLPQEAVERRELARWVLETEVGGLVAGLIGLWAVKSFER